MSSLRIVGFFVLSAALIGVLLGWLHFVAANAVKIEAAVALGIVVLVAIKLADRRRRDDLSPR
jgi:hypothetical protein